MIFVLLNLILINFLTLWDLEKIVDEIDRALFDHFFIDVFNIMQA
jgi:hypothetical protein